MITIILKLVLAVMLSGFAYGSEAQNPTANVFTTIHEYHGFWTRPGVASIDCPMWLRVRDSSDITIFLPVYFDTLVHRPSAGSPTGMFWADAATGLMKYSKWDSVKVYPNNLASPVTANKGGTGLSSAGTSGDVVMSNGSGFAMTTPPWALSSYTTSTYAPMVRSITINSSTKDLSIDRTWSLTTNDIPEGTDRYFTDALFSATLALKNTDNLSEGSTNKYFSNSLSRGSVSLTATGSSGSSAYNSTTGVLNVPAYTLSGLGGITLSALSATSPMLYNNATGIISSQVASGSQPGVLSSADWTVFNNKLSTAVTSVGLTSSDITVGGSSPITGTGTYILTLPTVNSNVGTFNASYTVNAKGQITSATNTSFNNSPSVTIQTVAASGNGNQLSSTKNVVVSYSVTIISTATIAGSATGYVALEICPTNSSVAGDWVEIGRVTNGQAVSLAITLQSVSTGGGQIGGTIPAGYYRRLRSVNTTGTPSYSYNSGQEVTY